MADKFKLNAITGEFDLVTDESSMLKLNQSTPQTVTGGAPIFNVGIKSNDDVIIKAGKKLVFDGE